MSFDIPAPLRFSGNTSTIEISPIIIAAQESDPVQASVTRGGIWDITSGKAEIATNGETQLLRFSVADPDLRLILTVAEDRYRLVARKSAGIHTVADLRGKRITTPLDTTAHWYLIKLLQVAKLSESDVVLVPVEPWAKQVEALAKGEVDAMAMWEPDPEIAGETLGDDAVFIEDESGYREIFNLYASAKILAEPQKRAAIVKFVASIISASERLNRNPQAYFPLISKSSGVSDRHLAAVWPDLSFPANINDNLVDILVEQEAWIALRQKRIARSRDELAGLIDADVYRDALSDSRRSNSES